MHLGQMTCAVGLAGKYMLRGVHSIEIKKSVHQIIQTAKVQLPLSVLIRNNDLLERVKLADKIKEGDSISLAFGYDGDNKTEFTGYIKRINIKQPLELECEDEMFLFRKVHVKKSFKKNYIKEVLQFLLDEVYKAFGVRIKLFENIPQVQVVNFIINNENGLWVLQELSDKYLQSSFITTVNNERILYCGLTYLQGNNKHVKHVINRNTINVDDLKFNSTELKVQYIVKIKRRDGTKEQKVFGDQYPDVVENYTPPPQVDEKTLEANMAELIRRKKAFGFSGSFTTFLIPAVEPGNITDITDPQFADRSGSYFIGTVTTTFDTGGAKRKPEIDFKTDEGK